MDGTIRVWRQETTNANSNALPSSNSQNNMSSSSSSSSPVPYYLNNSPSRGSSSSSNLISDIVNQSSYNAPLENDASQSLSLSLSSSSSSTSLSQKDNNNNNNNDYLNQKSEWRCEHTVESDGPVVSTEYGTYSPSRTTL